MNLNVDEILPTIPRGSLRSYTWVADRLGYEGDAARAAGQAIAHETLRRWPSPEIESGATDAEVFPWWRVVGLRGDVLTVRENEAWHFRQLERLEEEGHVVVASPDVDGYRVDPLPDDFE